MRSSLPTRTRRWPEAWLTARTSAIVAPGPTAVGVPPVVTRSRTVSVCSSSAPEICREYASSSAPTFAECSTRWRRSSGLWPVASWSVGSTPTRRRHQFAASFSTRSTGRVSHMKARIGVASMIADVSGCAMAHDFGAISPTTRCRNVTMISASTNPAASASHSGAPQSSKSGVSQWWTAGLVTAPRARVHAVMPSWEPASSTVSSVELRSAARADRLRGAASSSRYRLAARAANSIATKKALSAIRATVVTTTTTGSLIGPPPARARRPPHARRRPAAVRPAR